MKHAITIIPRIVGGIGNQLFCYAAARRFALVSNAELAIDHVSGFAYDHVYQRTYQLDRFHIPCRKATLTERLEPFSRVRRFLKRRINQRRPFEQRRYIRQEGIDFDPRLLELRPKGTVYLEGNWQSEGYFKDVESVIREDLKIRPPTDETNADMADRIRACQAVAVHVRFFDPPGAASVNNVSADYYRKAIRHMESKCPDGHYFVFSERPADAIAMLGIPDQRYTVVSHNAGDDNAYADLWLMTLCRHFIIANSTFSWWGAWLGDKPGKLAIAPSWKVVGPGKITSWGFVGLIPRKWTTL